MEFHLETDMEEQSRAKKKLGVEGGGRRKICYCLKNPTRVSTLYTGTVLKKKQKYESKLRCCDVRQH